MDNEIYDRQSSLNLALPPQILVIGGGGVGSWVTLFSAMVGIGHIVVVDDDEVSESNLVRTPFTLDHIGLKKVDALHDLIRERRSTAHVTPMAIRWEEVDEGIRKNIIDESTFVFDCRDAISPLPDTIPRSKQIITGGYDGFNATIHLFPNLDNIFGDEDVRYRITPSYLVPPVFIAATMINYMCVELPREMSAVQKKRKVSVSDTVMTSRIFNIDFTRLSRHLRFMFEGVQANKNLKVGTLMKKFPVE